MGVPSDSDVRLFYRVAFQRLDDGAALLELGRYNCAVYIAGYSVECILKALILANTSLRQRQEALVSFRGAVAHSLLRLSEQLKVVRMTHPPDVARALTYVTSCWSVDLRYQPGTGSREDAVRFTASSRRILAWADARM